MESVGFRPFLLVAFAALLTAAACSPDTTVENADDEGVLSEGGGDVAEPSVDSRPTPEKSEPCVASTTPPTEDEAQFEEIASQVGPAFNSYDAARLVRLVGEGPVHDPSLELGDEDTYATIEDWVGAAESNGDQLSIQGFGPGDPIQLFGRRHNDSLRSVGIDAVSFTLQVWTSRDCEWLINTVNEISSPHPCLYADIVEDESASSSCDSSFDPRSNHVAVWSGTEVLIFGGVSGTHDDPPLTSGLGYNPSTGEWRDLAPSPVALSSWPRLQGAWDGHRLVVAGMSTADGSGAPQDDSTAWGVTILSYYPQEDRWEVSPPLPQDERYGVGAMVATGTEVILAGGDTNAPQDDGWAYDLGSATWRRLPPAGIKPVEGIAGVWTGSEAIFAGGYSGPTNTIPAVAYDPRSDSWRDLADGPGPWIAGHELIWTGTTVLLHSGNAGPSHPTEIMLYDPEADAWTASSPLPMNATEDLASAWTGEGLLVWGGYATYGAGESANGAVYDPETDTWTETATSPLGSRCHHSGTWTPAGFLVFGGMPICGHPGVLAAADAAMYDPATDTWTKLDRQHR